LHSNQCASVRSLLPGLLLDDDDDEEKEEEEE
jgi:hypothetical protein